MVFAEPSNNESDQAFAEAIKKAGNVTLPIWGGDLVFDVSGEIDDANALKSIMLFKRYY